ncbi:MAG: hypothetical protein O9284_00840 [Steroidobacteraceae bacterium]|nr:hypothetical protein [Steroidobacteraceae bacterium]
MHVVYVVPFCLEATLRFVAGAAQIPGVVLSLLTQDPESKLPPEWRLGIRAHWQVRDAGRRAVRALGLRTGMTHLEWFRRPDGGLAISEVAARPPGAQFTSLLSYAHELDFYAAWPRLVATGRFAAPERRWAVGAAYVRGQGTGRVRGIHGLDAAQREFGSLVVESRLPRLGDLQKGGYEGAGYVILRHPDTRVVEQALMRCVQLVRVELG